MFVLQNTKHSCMNTSNVASVRKKFVNDISSHWRTVKCHENVEKINKLTVKIAELQARWLDTHPNLSNYGDSITPHRQTEISHVVL